MDLNAVDLRWIDSASGFDRSSMRMTSDDVKVRLGRICWRISGAGSSEPPTGGGCAAWDSVKFAPTVPVDIPPAARSPTDREKNDNMLSSIHLMIWPSVTFYAHAKSEKSCPAPYCLQRRARAPSTAPVELGLPGIPWRMC